MPALFDPNNAKGIEAPALYLLAERLSECQQFIELSETTSKGTARETITVGPADDPLDGEEFTKEELENEFFFCSVGPQDLEGHETGSPDTITECPDEGGRFLIYLRRQVRESELNATNGKSDVYLYFLDRVGAIAHQLHQGAMDNNQPKINSVSREFSPSFCDIASEVAQGAYIWASLVVDWGDTGE